MSLYALSALNTNNSAGTANALQDYVGLANRAVLRDGTNNTASDLGSGVLNPATFYSLQLLDTIRDAAENYQYFKYAQSAPIQGKADELTMRRWAPLQAHTAPLAEGVPPVSDKGSVEVYKISANSYGRVMEFTDKVDWAVVDPVVAIYSAEYSIVAVETLDLLARNMLITCAQKWFAAHVEGDTVTAKSAINEMAIGCVPKIADFRLMGLYFKTAKVKPHDSTYHVLVSPAFIFDMYNDPFVQNYMKINQTTQPFQNAAADDTVLVPMFGFSFHEVNNVSESSVFMDGTTKKFVEFAVLDSSNYSGCKLANGANATTSDYGKIGYKTKACTTTSGYVLDKRTGKEASYIPNQVICTPDDGFAVLKVNHIIVLGKDALLRTGLAGEDAAKMYVKALGSSGVLDPLDQRRCSALAA